jgi:hypothetical protein
MNKIYIELKAINTPKVIDRSLKQGNTYVFFVNENFDVKDRSDKETLINELNYQLKKDGMEDLNPSDRNLERELMRLEIGRRVEIRID